jgi:tetratricopeptide (TPR) repeat protein
MVKEFKKMKVIYFFISCVIFMNCTPLGELRLDLLVNKCEQCNDEIISSLIKYESVLPNEWKFNYCLGKCYYEKHAYKKAIENFKIAIEKNKKKEKIINKELIKVYKQAGDDFYNQAQSDSAAYYYHQLILLNNVTE